MEKDKTDPRIYLRPSPFEIYKKEIFAAIRKLLRTKR